MGGTSATLGLRSAPSWACPTRRRRWEAWACPTLQSFRQACQLGAAHQHSPAVLVMWRAIHPSLAPSLPVRCVQYAPYAPPAYGTSAAPPPPYYPYPGTQAYGQPAYAYGQPAYGAAPPYGGAPPYGQPAYGQPAYGAPPAAAGPAGMPPPAAAGAAGQPAAAGAAAPDFDRMSVADLKAFIRSRGANLEGAVEKADLVAIARALYTP